MLFAIRQTLLVYQTVGHLELFLPAETNLPPTLAHAPADFPDLPRGHLLDPLDPPDIESYAMIDQKSVGWNIPFPQASAISIYHVPQRFVCARIQFPFCD